MDMINFDEIFSVEDAINEIECFTNQRISIIGGDRSFIGITSDIMKFVEYLDKKREMTGLMVIGSILSTNQDFRGYQVDSLTDANEIVKYFINEDRMSQLNFGQINPTNNIFVYVFYLNDILLKHMTL